MKIGLVCPYSVYKGGGVQECVRSLQAELAKRGHIAKIITPQPRENPPLKMKDVVFIGSSTDIRSPFATTAQISASVQTDALRAMLKREQFDILHFHEPWVPILSRQLLRHSATKNIATFHAKLPETMMSRTIERVITPYTRSILKYLDALTAPSEAAAEYVRTLTNQPITIIPNGIDLTAYKHPEVLAPRRRESRQIVFIGRLEGRKGVKYLLNAVALLVKHHDVQVSIAGDGPDRKKLEEQTENLKVSNHVHFLGYVDEKTKHQLLHDADVLCSPALFGESFGIILLEGLASGVPIVAGDNPGYVGVMKERGVLSLVNPKDVPDFARRLELFLYDDEIARLWRMWAATYVQQFAYPRVVDAYEALYHQVLGEK